MIHLQDINKTYQGAQPLHVLKGISLDIAKGEFVTQEPTSSQECLSGTSLSARLPSTAIR